VEFRHFLLNVKHLDRAACETGKDEACDSGSGKILWIGALTPLVVVVLEGNSPLTAYLDDAKK
jgi:hypothetical protein